MTPPPDDAETLTPAQQREAEDRKQRSHARLRAEGVPINEHLPWIETADAAHFRSTDEVARRALGLMACVGRSHGVPTEVLASKLGTPDFSPFLTPAEREFMADPLADEQRRLSMSWAMESVHVLLWSLGLVDDLGRPDHQCGGPEILKAFAGGIDALVARATRRSDAELLDAADLIYRWHWAVRDDLLRRRPAPAGLDPGIVQEWHHAINWLVGYMDGAEWDDVTTDT